MERRKPARPIHPNPPPMNYFHHYPHDYGYDHFPHFQYVIFEDDDDYFYKGRLKEGNRSGHDTNPYPPPPPPPPPPMPTYSKDIDYQFQWELQRAYMKGFDAGFAAAVAYMKSEETEEETTVVESANEKKE